MTEGTKPVLDRAFLDRVGAERIQQRLGLARLRHRAFRRQCVRLVELILNKLP